MVPEQNPSRIYMERSGSGVDTDIDILMSPPENPLSDEEKQAVSKYAYDLMAGSLGDTSVESDKSLKEVNETNATKEQHTYYIDFFMDHENVAGREVFQQHGYDGPWEREEVKKFLVSSSYMHGLDNKTRSELATASLKYTKKVAADHLLNDPEGKTDYIFTEWDTVTAHYDPDALLGKFKDLLAYRAFYKEASRQLPDNPTGVDDAKLAVLNIHRGRVNSIIAELYPSLLELQDTMTYGDTNQASDVGVQIAQLGSVVQRIFTTEQQKVTEGLYRRLDFLRNGAEMVAGDDGTTHLDTVSTDLLQALEEQEKKVGIESEISAAEQMAMDNTVWDAAQAKLAAEIVLSEWGQLSQETADWNEVKNRTGKPSDQKFQVVITPEADSLSVTGAKYVMNIEESFSRTLTQNGPTGALYVIAHELAHVAQIIADNKLALVLPIAEIKGRNVSATREAGGLYQEAAIRRILGRAESSVGANYLAALRVKQSGGNRIEASRAFFNTYLESEGVDLGDEASVRKAAALAVDRPNRLYRFGGYNTQPLAYAEQALVVGALNRQSPERAAAFVIASGSFNIKDALTLHRYGLLPEPQTSLNPAESVMKMYKEKISPMIYNQDK